MPLLLLEYKFPSCDCSSCTFFWYREEDGHQPTATLIQRMLLSCTFDPTLKTKKKKVCYFLLLTYIHIYHAQTFNMNYLAPVNARIWSFHQVLETVCRVLLYKKISRIWILDILLYRRRIKKIMRTSRVKCFLQLQAKFFGLTSSYLLQKDRHQGGLGHLS